MTHRFRILFAVLVALVVFSSVKSGTAHDQPSGSDEKTIQPRIDYLWERCFRNNTLNPHIPGCEPLRVYLLNELNRSERELAQEQIEREAVRSIPKTMAIAR